MNNSLLSLDPLPVIYKKESDKETLNLASPNPLTEHSISIDDSIFAGMDMDAIQAKILPTWGSAPGTRHLTKTIVTRADVLAHLQTKYKFYSLTNGVGCSSADCATFRANLHAFYEDTEFYKNYNFMNWKIAEPLNHSSDFVGISALSQYATPIMHAFGPLYVLFIPLLILIMDLICGTDANTCSSKYICHVYQLLNRHFIGKRIFQLDVPVGITGLLLGLWAVYYIFQGYMQYTQARKFTKHLFKAAEWIQNIKHFTEQAYSEWTIGFQSDVPFQSLSPAFYNQMADLAGTWKEISDSLPNLPVWPYWKITDGPSMSRGLVQLYRLFTSEKYMTALFYVPSWLEYIGALQECAHQMEMGVLTPAVFIDNTELACMDNHMHPALPLDAVPNSVPLHPNVILTGENASGKSTCMRSVFANILLSQSIGLGRYSKCHLVPYTHFHLYMNIPDVLEKDSLFEAEVRQCKDILNTFSEGGHHFCAFDELFTGTNPLDAETITYAYLYYISTQCPNVQFWLTTHFHDACRKLNEHLLDNLLFCEMKPGYQMTSGISSTANAVSVLTKFEFPEEIIQSAK
jgi:hypothetical protein